MIHSITLDHSIPMILSPIMTLSQLLFLLVAMDQSNVMLLSLSLFHSAWILLFEVMVRLLKMFLSDVLPHFMGIDAVTSDGSISIHDTVALDVSLSSDECSLSDGSMSKTYPS